MRDENKDDESDDENKENEVRVLTIFYGPVRTLVNSIDVCIRITCNS